MQYKFCHLDKIQQGVDYKPALLHKFDKQNIKV